MMNIKSYKLLKISLYLIFIFPIFSTLKASNLDFLETQTALHEGLSGISLLDKGEDALLARAWLADQAEESIDVQYFIWSSDNIGILAAEALLRAAERGVVIRVIVDDLLIDAPDNILLALSLHPNINIRIYNPQHSVGTTLFERFANAIKNFRSFNQRMHDKTFSVDKKVVITGGRNMADEYFDFNQTYNFRDRDVLVVGKAVKTVENSFNNFWESDLTHTINQRFKDHQQLNYMGDVNSLDVQELYKELHLYAQSSDNFEPGIKLVLDKLSISTPSFLNNMTWANVQFIYDNPGKNDQLNSFHAGGNSSSHLADLVNDAKQTIVIQSPYLILSDEAKILFKDAIKRGVKITISTNSLSSTDNLQAFSGYKKQRDKLLSMGINIFEYKPNPQTQLTIMKRYSSIKKNNPVFAIHAKSMVLDSNKTFIGTFNLDPRSQNLNTEVGVVINDQLFAQKVEKLIIIDTDESNSWPAHNNPDQYASWMKRSKVIFWQLFSMDEIL